MVDKGSSSQETMFKALNFLKFGLYLKFKTIAATHGYKFLESRGRLAISSGVRNMLLLFTS